MKCLRQIRHGVEDIVVKIENKLVPHCDRFQYLR